MEFGLGLILSFTDNATAGINNAVNSLGQLTQVADSASASLDKMASLSAFSVMTDRLGSSFMSAGGGIISTLTGVISKVNQTGQTLMYAENQLDALYAKSGKTGKEVIGEIQAYAKTSMFEFENLIPAVTSLKSVGIEAFDSITSSMGNSTNNLLDYASALASFAPQMRNAYGTGINASIGALREYIAEGNKKSLKSGAGLDITQILGEDKGETIEERTRQVADLIEQLGMLGMVDTMKNSPMTKLSNMGDTLFEFVGMVSQSGVYDAINNLITIFADFVNTLDEERLQTIAVSVAGALSSLIKPIEWIAKKIVSLAESLFNLIETHPEIAKFVIMGGALVGVFLLLTGIALKLASAFSGLSLMLMSSGKSFKSIGGLMQTGAKRLIGTFLPLIAVTGLLALAWKNDFAGIRTNVTKFVSNLSESFKTAKQAVSGSVEDLSTTLTNLRNKGDFFSNLTIGMMQVMTLVEALADVWSDNTLSEDLFLKAQELGILPLIENILDLKYRFDFFKQGFKEGWESIGNIVSNVLSSITSNVEGTFLQDIISGITDLLDSLSSSDTETWLELGRIFADISAKAIVLFAVLSPLKKIGGAVSGISGVLKPLLGLIASHPVVAIIIGIVGALALLYAKCEPFRELVNNLFSGIVSAIGSIIEPMKEVALNLFLQMLPIIMQVVDAIKSFMPQIQSFIEQFGGTLATIISSVMELIIGLMPSISQYIGIVISTIISLMPSIMNIMSVIMSVIQGILPLINQLITMAVPFITQVVSMLSQLVANVMPIIVDLINTVTGVISELIALLMPMLTSIMESLMPIIQTIMNIVTSLMSHLIPVIQNVVGIVANIIKMVLNIAVPIITVIVQVVQTIIGVLMPILNTILNWIGFLIDIVVGIVQIVVSVVARIVAVVTGIINVIVSVISAIVQAVRSVIAVITGIIRTIVETISSIMIGIIDIARNIWDGIVNTFSGVIDFFTGIFNAVYNRVSAIFHRIAKVFTDIWNGIVSSFSTLGDTISGAIKGAVNKVLSFATNIINGFIKSLNFAIGIINAIPGVNISKITLLDVPKLAEGGVVDKPTTAIIGEAGKEAVVPLENNLGWISSLARMLAYEMSTNLVPTNTSGSITNNQGDTNQKYLTSSNTNNTTYEGDTDNSVIFNEGAIQVTVQNASEEEAFRLAKMILEYIKRQKELDKMMCYA